ncbi:gp106 [Mycobacterium phage Omega]|uniref:Uncharacterized protein n=3 Tax=Omegavirus TaxID=1623292 RepID=Q854G1_BPMOM|nr:gp106 [Mycobacterium phage Omega]YP_009011991.1 hypothetical protein CM09_gp092 [Mycobacterium phage Courthouse]YP_009205226.1 hypothetical protein AVT17_gp096 [Mycobacterium phage Ariel]YP_009213314.1 hypothetical protein AVV70_gp097 [Mycobacterium phage MiaZeal]ASD50725.1 hypothetical protein PORCELAIN_95 [Mycobacterium phage Porcelain]ASD53487.1 hypothetical protein PBI_LUCKY2013_94 [Mycobacterium phage Lucky2013]ASZ74171.1 hypothetical protein SEA_SQUINT_95 [Mycobacterium phage Squint]
MTDSTMLREAAIKKLMDIQEACRAELLQHPMRAYRGISLANEILDIIKGE